MAKTITEDGNNKTSSKNITKGKSLNTNFSHPAYTRYPQLMGKNYFGVASDYINSEGNLRYTKWKKTFVFTPKKTISGKKVWLKTVYKRRRWLHIEPPQFPVDHFHGIEYAEWDEILNLKMKN